MGVIMNGGAYHDLKRRMDAIKLRTFGTTEVVLHRREIIDKAPPFHPLRNADVRTRFDSDLLQLFMDARYTALTVMIDKHQQIKKYTVYHINPYHYCLTAMVERYVLWLQEKSLSDGRVVVGDVMAEWRGPEPNEKLKNAYAHLYKHGTGELDSATVQTYLSSGELKVEKKEANDPGLQLADLVAHPARTYLICRMRNERMKAKFGRDVVTILIRYKYRKRGRKISGFGIKLLP